MTTPTHRLTSPPARRGRGGGPREGNQLFAYVIAVLLAATVIVPVLYVAHRRLPHHARSSTTTRSALPIDGTFANYTFVLAVRRLLASGLQQHAGRRAW